MKDAYQTSSKSELDSISLSRERAHHDKWASQVETDNIDVDKFFEASTAPENRFILEKLGDIRGKSILDLGCGIGESSVYFAKQGGICTAADYSPGMLEVAMKVAEKNGVSIKTAVTNAMDIKMEDNSFDIVYAANLLHHVEPEKALMEIHRVLKPGGKACFWDPLKHNPIINIYRRMASEVRSEDEHPLDIKILDFIRSIFKEVEFDTFWLCTLWIFLRFYLIERVNPNDERYWKKIIYDEERIRNRYLFLEKIDKCLKKLIPFSRRYAWNIAVVATKQTSASKS